MFIYHVSCLSLTDHKLDESRQCFVWQCIPRASSLWQRFAKAAELTAREWHGLAETQQGINTVSQTSLSWVMGHFRLHSAYLNPILSQSSSKLDKPTLNPKLPLLSPFFPFWSKFSWNQPNEHSLSTSLMTLCKAGGIQALGSKPDMLLISCLNLGK